MSLKFGLKEELIYEIVSFAKKYDVEKLIIFGSRARGDYKERSDIDLAVKGGDVQGFSLSVDEEASTLLRFDILDLGSELKEELLESIAKEGIIIYEKV